MQSESGHLTKRVWNDYVFLTRADRLVIRPPLIGYFGMAGMYLMAVLVEWVAVEIGFMSRETLTYLPFMLAAGLAFIVILWGRWWTLDRHADSIRYFPWRLCAASSVRGIRVLERRVGKRNHGRAYSVKLELEKDLHVRFSGFCYAPHWTQEEAMVLATAIGDWLNVAVQVENLSP